MINAGQVHPSHSEHKRLGSIWDKCGKQLLEASNAVPDAGVWITCAGEGAPGDAGAVSEQSKVC